MPKKEQENSSQNSNKETTKETNFFKSPAPIIKKPLQANLKRNATKIIPIDQVDTNKNNENNPFSLKRSQKTWKIGVNPLKEKEVQEENTEGKTEETMQQHQQKH